MHGIEMSPSKENVIAGGVPNSVIRLAKALNNIEIKSILITNDRKFRETGEKTTCFTLPWADVQLIPIDGKYANIKYSLKYLFKTVRKIKQINKERGLDLIHGHSGHPGLAIVTEVATRFTKIPAVHTIYSPVKTESKACFFYKNFLKDIRKIIAISDTVKFSLNGIGISNEKIEVIPPLLDFSVFKPDVGGKNVRSTLNINDDEFVILYLGNLTKTKGIDVVLDAMSMVKKQYPNIKLLSGIELTHSGTDIRKKEISSKIKTYNLSQDIIELGLITNVERVMDAADVVVAPFQNTHLVADYPLAVLDSMAVGTPVITTMVGGIPEIINSSENGILINPDDPSALSHEIINLIDNPRERREIGKRAASFVREKFPEKEITEMTKQVYKEVIQHYNGREEFYE
jgi:glycosyltransferase involved in cell wall biosynthesis